MTDYTELRQRALALRAEGRSVPQIADELGIPRITVYSWVPREEDLSQFSEMAEMREAGKTTTEIADAFGISRQRVSAVLGPSARRGRRPDARRAIRVRLAEDDYERVVTIARDLGITIEGGAETGRGSLNALLEEIARGGLVVSWRDGRNRYAHLIDTGP